MISKKYSREEFVNAAMMFIRAYEIQQITIKKLQIELNNLKEDYELQKMENEFLSDQLKNFKK